MGTTEKSPQQLRIIPYLFTNPSETSTENPKNYYQHESELADPILADQPDPDTELAYETSVEPTMEIPTQCDFLDGQQVDGQKTGRIAVLPTDPFYPDYLDPLPDDFQPIPSLPVVDNYAETIADFLGPEYKTFPNYAVAPLTELNHALLLYQKHNGERIPDQNKKNLQLYETDYEEVYRFILGKLNILVGKDLEEDTYPDDIEQTAIVSANSLRVFDALLSSVMSIYQGKKFRDVFPTLRGNKLQPYAEAATILNSCPEIHTKQQLAALFVHLWERVQSGIFISSKTIPFADSLGLPNRNIITNALQDNDLLTKKAHRLMYTWVCGLFDQNEPSLEFDREAFSQRQIGITAINEYTKVITSALYDGIYYKYGDSLTDIRVHLVDLKSGAIDQLNPFKGEAMRRQAESKILHAEDLVTESLKKHPLSYSGHELLLYPKAPRKSFPNSVKFFFKRFWDPDVSARWVSYTEIDLNEENRAEAIAWQDWFNRALWQFEDEIRPMLNERHAEARKQK